MPVNLPNLITIARILLVPVIIWLIVSGAYLAAFVAFIAAGISDGVDGFIAKKFRLQTKLGAWLDPLADKLLLVAIYLSLGFLKELPAWLVIL
ncbi:MAG TPA: CDP-alcohol phosphatidyltransferase family protein, partial [Rhizobiales bacterium]|nr:CDP-alcohol phosphatidyltransferase family protein [Hyphomicrobiales bacterium]